MTACLAGKSEVVKVLIEAKASINTLDNDGRSALFIACKKGHYEIVQMFFNLIGLNSHHYILLLLLDMLT